MYQAFDHEGKHYHTNYPFSFVCYCWQKVPNTIYLRSRLYLFLADFRLFLRPYIPGMRLMTTILLAATFLLEGVHAFCQNTILWQITKTGSTHTSYLLGTYHQMGNSFIDSLPRIKKELTRADVAVFESIGDPQKVKDVLNQRQPTNDIESALSNDDMASLLTISKNWGVDVHKLKPMELYAKLQQEYFKTTCGTVLPTDKWDHFDNYLIHLARSNNIRLNAFETDSMQMDAINRSGGEWKEMKKPIHFWIHTTMEPRKDDKKCADAHNYMAFKFDYGLDKPCSNDVILGDRNREWLKKLPALLESNNCFIAVGLFHLFTNCGLIAQLREMGYTVEPVILR
ncbi:MAG: TraB/GumN family protein [Flavipsychrobacter sp.]|nr:TraB/GumN family protein [Flavipsychrobacter sp.]